MQQFYQFIILTFIYSSTCFGRFPAHHQELNDCSGSLSFYLRIVVIVVLRSWSGRPAGPTTNTVVAVCKLGMALKGNEKYLGALMFVDPCIILYLTASSNYTSNIPPRMQKPEAASAVLGS